MSETPVQPPSNVTPISEAFQKAKRVSRKPKADKPPAADSSGGLSGGRGDHYGEVMEPPRRLPPHAPCTALGRCGTTYYFLDSAGQCVHATVEKLGRLFIIGLFGGEEYLVKLWPRRDRKGRIIDEFDHGKLGPVLIASCAEKPLFNPIEQVRGPGAWREEDGGIVMHCGDALYTAQGEQPTGLRRGYLYPAAPALLPPRFDGGAEAAREVLEKLETWSWSRGALDAKLVLGWIGAAMLGGASDWRPLIWVTGDFGSGKSTFQKFVRYVLGPKGMIACENASRAYVFQKVGNSSLPVALDEFESQANNQRRLEIIELARISASGGSIGRGGADGTPSEFRAFNTFAFSSILIPPLEPADRSRMAIVDLMKRPSGARREPGEDDAMDDNAADFLGAPEKWETIGQKLRGRLIVQWRRYGETFRAFRRALIRAGHSDRSADQFGALGAAYDLLLHDDPIADDRAAEWARMLPASQVAQTITPDPDACLQHLLTAMVDLFRGGTKDPVGHYLAEARAEIENARTLDANRLLGKIGIKLFRDDRIKDGPAQWWIAVMNNHRELAKIFENSKWGGMPGTSGGWSQSLSRVEYQGAAETLKAFKSKFRFVRGANPAHCAVIPWEAAFPPASDELDADEIAIMDKRDRE